MKNRYEEQLEQLINEYGLAYKEACDSTEIHNILMDLFKTRCDGKRVALWGAGRKNTENSHAAVILKKYTTYIQGMCCLIDSLPELQGDEFMGYPIIAPQDIEQHNIDIVIIASKVQADSIVKDLHSIVPDCEYIDIYGELKNRGMVIYHKFYEESNIYTTLYQLRKACEEEREEVRKGEKLWTIISAYLSIQDFHLAKQFAKQYYEGNYKNADKLKEFFAQLEQLELEIQKINASKKEDVVIFFVDSLRAMDVYHKDDMGQWQGDMLKPYLKGATIFTNAKSTGVTTYESMVSVVKQRYPYEQNVYENNIMADFEEFKLLPLVKEKGFDIRFYISEGYQIIHNHPDVYFKKQVYLPSKMWKLVTDMACADEKTFNFIYVPYELHFPLICGYHKEEPKVSGFVDVGVKDTKDYVPRQLEECKEYVDCVFNYYKPYFSDDILFSVFADHSQVVYDDMEQKPYFMYYNKPERCVNVAFFVRGYGITEEWNEQLVSLYDFSDIFQSLIEKKQLNVPDRKIAIYQYYKIHYKKLREYAMDNGMEDYIDGMQCFVTDEGIYMVTAAGREEAFCQGQTENIIDTEKGQAIKRQVTKNYAIEFPKFILEE